MGETEKVSITLGKAELKRAKRLAADLGLSLSTFINDSVRRRIEAQERKAAGELVLASFSPEELPSKEEMRALLARWKPSSAGEVAGRRPGGTKSRGRKATRSTRGR